LHKENRICKRRIGSSEQIYIIRLWIGYSFSFLSGGFPKDNAKILWGMRFREKFLLKGRWSKGVYSRKEAPDSVKKMAKCGKFKKRALDFGVG
jgi:hypothetical protein